MALLDAAYILAAVRRLLAEYSSVRWTDDHLNKWVQEAATDISIKTGGYEQTHLFETVDGTLEYDEPDGCIKVHSCIKGGVRAASATWVEHLDDSDWYDYYYSLGGNPEQIIWDGTKWDIGIWNGTALQELGTWVESYRPDYIRITYTGALQWKLIDTGNSDIVTQDAYTSEQQVTINWGSNDIKRIKFYFDANDSITNIEFGTAIAAISDTDYKGLSRIHPRLVQHVAHNETGEPIHYYHHHSKVGIWPLADDVYAVTVYYSKVTETITDLPTELRLLAIPYCLALARLSEGWEDDFEMFITMYLNGLMPHRADRGQYKLNAVDARDKFRIPEGKVVNG